MTRKLSIPMLTLALIPVVAACPAPAQTAPPPKPRRRAAAARRRGRPQRPATSGRSDRRSRAAGSSTSPSRSGKPNTFYAASASGGLWKTENNGQTFEPLFENEKVFSIGDVAVAPSDPDVLWLGSGEANNSRSTYWGDGVYKSADAGKTWTQHGPQGIPPYRAHRHPSDRPQHRLRGRPRPSLFREPRARALQDDRRRQDLGQGPRRRRRRPGRRRRRPGHGPDRTRRRSTPRPTTGSASPGPGASAGRAPASTRRPTAARPGRSSRTACPAASSAASAWPIFPKNPKILYAEIENANKPGMSAEDRWKEVLGGQVERGHDRRRDLPLRRRRRDLDQGQPGEAVHRRRSRLLLRPDHRRPERRQRRLRPERRRPGQPGRRQDLDAAVPLRRRQPRPLDRSRRTAGTCSSATTTAWA